MMRPGTVAVKILLIEDDDETANHVARALRAAGHAVERAADGETGLAMAQTRAHDLAIVDRMLPKRDGLNLVRQLRQEGWPTPVLFLTTRSGISDRIAGLEGGGDDYLAKPFSMEELLARAQALGRRLERQGAGIKTRLLVGELEVDLIDHSVRRSGQRIDLQPQEFRILEYLARHAGQIVTKKMLLENVWQLYFEPGTNIVETHMSRLRTKLDKPFAEPLIRTLRGSGYMLHV